MSEGRRRAGAASRKPPMEEQGRRWRDPAAEGAFELWLHLALHASFDAVAKEPIPPELLALIAPKRPED